jgi:hypothetical protein
VVTYGPEDLTPWEQRNGLWYKREDLHRNDYGVNGAKYRLCRHLIKTAVENAAEFGVDIDSVVTAQSVRSPQAAITATLCEEMGLDCYVVVGASKPETAVKHRSIEIAVEAGAMLDTSCRVAYNGVIQPYGERLAEGLGAYQVPYAISPPANASRAALEAALAVGGAQVEDMPLDIQTLVIPFGSGNTTAGILYGLAGLLRDEYPSALDHIVLVGVGPDRTEWLWDRLGAVGVDQDMLPQIEHFPLHGWFAEYADLMPETLDGIVMHPTYEGKVVRFLNEAEPEWWASRDGTTGFWIVGGPM